MNVCLPLHMHNRDMDNVSHYYVSQQAQFSLNNVHKSGLKHHHFSQRIITGCNLKTFSGKLLGNRAPCAFSYNGFSWDLFW